MANTATPSVTPIPAEPGWARPRRTAIELARRAKQRRQIQFMVAASYMLDSLILLLYAHAGTVPVFIGPAFAVCGLVSVLFYLVLSEIGFTERFKDHYFVVPQLFISVTIMLAFTWV